MRVHVRFMSTNSKFQVVREEMFPNHAAALAAVIDHATAAGFSDVKEIFEDDNFRYTARTPGGRNGRNVAFGEYDVDGDAQ